MMHFSIYNTEDGKVHLDVPGQGHIVFDDLKTYAGFITQAFFVMKMMANMAAQEDNALVGIPTEFHDAIKKAMQDDG